MEQIFTAKTIEEAVDLAAAELNLSKDSFSYEIEEYPSKGFLGIGSKPAKIKVTYELSVAGTIRSYIDGLFGIIGISGCTTEITEEGDHIQVQIDGEEAELFLKRQGEAVEALQMLIAMTLNKEEKNKYKVTLNINDFREQNKQRLEHLASKTAKQVLRTKKRVTLAPMSAYQRRIVHSALQEEKDITTFSIGDEPNRRVVVSYSGPDMRQGGGYNNKGYNKGYGNKGGYQNRPKKPYNKQRNDNRPYHSEEAPSAPVQRTARPGESIKNATVIQKSDSTSSQE